ncbi:unnamed protein product [Closterium sp. Naga37s-1]|nr:unnamed protein product [Closterium sp. Naga37s-1]
MMTRRLPSSRVVLALALVALLCFAGVDHAACSARSLGLPRFGGLVGGSGTRGAWSFFRPPRTSGGGGSGAMSGGQSGQGGFGSQGGGGMSGPTGNAGGGGMGGGGMGGGGMGGGGMGAGGMGAGGIGAGGMGGGGMSGGGMSGGGMGGGGMSAGGMGGGGMGGGGMGEGGMGGGGMGGGGMGGGSMSGGGMGGGGVGGGGMGGGGMGGGGVGGGGMGGGGMGGGGMGGGGVGGGGMGGGGMGAGGMGGGGMGAGGMGGGGMGGGSMGGGGVGGGGMGGGGMGAGGMGGSSGSSVPPAFFRLPCSPFLVPPVLFRLTCSPCPVPPASPCPVPPAPFPLPRSPCPVPPAPFPLPRSPCPVPPAPFPLPRSPCPVPPALFPLPRSPCPVPSSPFPLPCPPGHGRVMESNGCPGYAWRGQATQYSPVQQALSFAVPLAPTLASSTIPVALSGTCKMGPIGFVLNGVPFYSACDALGRDALQYEGATFDACGGHPTPSGQYHYHVAPGVANPSAISASRSTNFNLCNASFWQDAPGQHSPLLGFLADGIPLFGPRGAGGALPAGVDECGGHVGDGSGGEPAFYHYHASSTAPYTVACLKGCVSSSDWGNLGSASCTKATKQYDYSSLAAVQAV